MVEKGYLFHDDKSYVSTDRVAALNTPPLFTDPFDDHYPNNSYDPGYDYDDYYLDATEWYF